MNGIDPIVLNQLRMLVDNISTLRSSFWANLGDERRDLDKECGYPKGLITPEQYQLLWERDPVGNRVDRCLPEDTWLISPELYEDESVEDFTAFEQAWVDLGKGMCIEPSHADEAESHPLIEDWERVDVLSGIGSYGIMVLGLDDERDLSLPVLGMIEQNSIPLKGVEKDSEGRIIPPGDQERPRRYDRFSFSINAEQTRGRKLSYVHCLPEVNCPISAWEINPSSPRYGQPHTYQVTFNDPGTSRYAVGPPLGTMMVHWTRVIHVADNLEASKLFGAPRCRPVYNRIVDCQKIYGAGGEGYWKAGFPGISYETHPQMGGDVQINKAQTRRELENYMNSLQRMLVGVGMTAKTLAPNVADPTAFLKANLEAISINLDIPMRILLGSERGELSSNQDDRRWKAKSRKRRVRHASPRIAFPTTNRLINVGVLPVPPKGFKCWWADADSQTEPEKADVALKKTQAITTYIQGNGDSLYAPKDYLSRVMGETEKDAETIVVDAASFQSTEGGLLPEPEVVTVPGGAGKETK